MNRGLWISLFSLLVCSKASANPWVRNKGETYCELGISRALGAGVLSGKPTANSISSCLVYIALTSKVDFVKQTMRKEAQELEAREKRYSSRFTDKFHEGRRQYYDSKLLFLETTHKEYLTKVGNTLAHALYHFLPATFYTASIEYGIREEIGAVAKFVIADYARVPSKFILEAGAKYKAAEFRDRTFVLLPWASYETSKDWNEFKLGASASITRNAKAPRLLEKLLQAKDRFSYSSLGGHIPLGQPYFSLKAETLQGIESHFALCPYGSSAIKVDLPRQGMRFPLLFYECSFGIAKKWEKGGAYLQITFQASKLDFLKSTETKKAVLSLMQPEQGRDALEEMIFDKSLLSLKSFTISGGFTKSF